MAAIYPDLRDKVVLVTGGGSGIGEAIVREFARQRAKVAFIDLAVERSRALLKTLEQAGTPVHFEPCDLTDIPALQRTIGAVRSRLGPIQILVNNAANDDRHATDAVTEAVWDGGIFYHTDTVQRVVYAFDRPTPATLAGKRVFVRIEAGAGFPDGTAVDAHGCVWIALWGGWGVRRYSPSGELLGIVRFPCANVTKVAFGGPDWCTVYATTAWKGLSPLGRAAQPLAGDLFRFRTDVPGSPPVEVALRA